MGSLSVLTLNIANPSLDRAKRQLEWFAGQDDELLVLTESKASRGCAYLVDSFRGAGYTVIDSKPEAGDYGVLLVSRCELHSDDLARPLDCLPSRFASALLPTSEGRIRIVGIYAPSTNPAKFSPNDKKQRKRNWLESLQRELARYPGSFPQVVIGDFNVIETGHRPPRQYFDTYEYEFYTSLSTRFAMVDAFRQMDPDGEGHSWIHSSGAGYRYDHAFCSTDLATKVTGCRYDHQVRAAKLSDHSALRLTLAIGPRSLLDVSDLLPTSGGNALF